MIEYTDGRRNQAEIRKMFLGFIREARAKKADTTRRRILKYKIAKALEK